MSDNVYKSMNNSNRFNQPESLKVIKNLSLSEEDYSKLLFHRDY